MITMKINQDKVTPEAAQALVQICPFSAISYDGKTLDIGAGCKTCGICAKKGPAGVVEFIEEPDEQQLDRSQWNGICVYADHEDGQIHPVTYELLGKARELADQTAQPVYALLIGYGVLDKAQDLLRYGADKVFVYDKDAFKHFVITPYANAFEDFINKIKPSSILVGATNMGRSLAPRIAARFRTGLTADCTRLEIRENTDLVQIRPAFGGNIMAKILTPKTRPQLCTVRYKVFSARQPGAPTGEVVTMSLPEDLSKTCVKILNVQRKKKEKDLSEADVIVAAGRGLKNKSDLDLIYRFARALGAEVAGTRPLIEAGWLDPKHQIGLSGRTVKPKLIVTVGISGSVQFASGMDGAECIVAINQDKSAPIFEISHYGFVGDLYQILPALLEKIEEVRADV